MFVTHTDNLSHRTTLHCESAKVTDGRYLTHFDLSAHTVLERQIESWILLVSTSVTSVRVLPLSSVIAKLWQTSGLLSLCHTVVMFPIWSLPPSCQPPHA